MTFQPESAGLDLVDLRRRVENGLHILSREDISALFSRVETLQAERSVLAEVAAERARQDAKWGEQNHPDGTGEGLILPNLPANSDAHAFAGHLAIWARWRTDRQHRAGAGTYEQILTEEWAEVIASEEPADLRKELIQLAAVCVAWCEKIDRDAEPHPKASDAA